MNVAREALHAALVMAAFGAIFGAAELWRRRFQPPVEWTRKAVHFACGLVALGFPLLFGSPWTVLALGALSALMMLATRRAGLMGSVHGVERSSRGDVYYPLAIVLLFLLARDRPVLYAVSLLTLVVGDALAAVLGQRYGRATYLVEGGRRSWEGSAVFFLASFLLVHLPLLLLTDVGRAHSVLVALQVALLVTSFEAVSLGGNDNLVVPLGTYYLLVKMLPKTPALIGAQVLAQLGFLALAALIAWRTRALTASGAIAAHLVLYAAFSLGAPAWSVAPGLALAGLVALDRFSTQARERRAGGGVLENTPHGHQVLAVFYVSIVAVLLIFADNTFATFLRERGARLAAAEPHPFYVPFVSALAAQVGTLAYAFLRTGGGMGRRPRAVVGALAAALGFVTVAPASLWLAPGRVSTGALAVAAAICAVGLTFYLIVRSLRWKPRTALWDFRLQAASVALAVLLVLPLHLRVIGAW